MMSAQPGLQKTADDIFDQIDKNSDGLITRSEFNSMITVKRKPPVASARVLTCPSQAEVVTNSAFPARAEVVKSSVLPGHREVSENSDHKMLEKLDQIISEKLEVWFGQPKGQEFISARLESAVASIREDFNTLRIEQSGQAKKLQEEVKEFHTLRHLVESRMADVNEVHRDSDGVSRELHSQVSLRLTKNHEDLCKQMEVERQQRSKDIQELSATLGSRITEYLNHESHERAEQLEDLRRSVDAETTKSISKLEEHSTWQLAAEATNQEIVNHVLALRGSHKSMEDILNQHVGEQSEKHKTSTKRHDELVSRLDLHQENWQSDFEKATGDLMAKIEEIRCAQQRFENSTGLEKERNNNRHKSTEDDVETKHTRIVSVLDEQRATWEAKLHELQSRLDSFVFRLDNVDTKLNSGFDSLGNSMLERETKLDTQLLTSQQQCVNQIEAVDQQHMKNLKEERAQRDRNIQELRRSLREEFREEISQLAAKCDAFKEVCSKDTVAVQKSLQKSVDLVHNELDSVHNELARTISEKQDAASQETNNIVRMIRSEIEKGLVEVGEQVKQVQSRLVDLQEDTQKMIEEERAMHSSSQSEHNARSQQLNDVVNDLQVQFNRELSEAKVEKGAWAACVELERKIEVEHHTRTRLIEEEAACRTQKLDELHNSVQEKIDMSLQKEREERDVRCNEVHEYFTSQTSELKEALGKQSVCHEELMASHQQLVDLHRELDSSHAKLSTRLEDVDEAHKLGHNRLADNHETAMQNHKSTLEAKYDAKINDIHDMLQRVDAKVTEHREDQDCRHGDFKSEVDSRFGELSRIVNEDRSLSEARFSRLEPRVDTNVYRLDSHQAELNSATAALREQIGETEGALSQSFQASLQQAMGEIDAVHREMSAATQKQNAQLSSSIRELAQKLPEEISSTAQTSQRMVAELKKEIYAALKELDRSVLARHTESVIATKHEMNSLFDRLQVDFEEGLRKMDKKVDDFHRTSLAERASLVKAMEEERATVRKAHEEHTRCINVEHDARVNENSEIRAFITKGLADGRRVHQESHDKFQSMMDLEFQRRSEHFETERAARALDSQQFHEILGTRVANFEKQETDARNKHIEEVSNYLRNETAKHDERYNVHWSSHNDLLESHKKLMTSHNSLLGSHEGLKASHGRGQESQAQGRQEFASLLESERHARASGLKSLDEAHRGEVANLQQAVRGVQEALNLSLSQLDNKHDALGRNADLKHKETNHLIAQRFAAWEVKLGNIGSCTDANAKRLNAIRDDLSKGMSDVNGRIMKAQELLEKTNAQTRADLSSALKDKVSELHEKSANMQKKLSDDISEVDAKCDRCRSVVATDSEAALSKFEHIISARCDATVNDYSVQTNKFVQGLKKENDATVHEMQSRIDELRTALVQERNNHVKWMDEERTAFRKAHDEHVHIVEVERDTRLRQLQDLRADFMKSLNRDAVEDKPRTQVGPQRPVTLGGSVSSVGSIGVLATGSMSTAAGSTTKLGSLLANLKASK